MQGFDISLWCMRGNQSSSPEEADIIGDLVANMLQPARKWVDGDGIEKELELKDVLIITPYNAQVFELQKALPGGGKNRDLVE